MENYEPSATGMAGIFTHPFTQVEKFQILGNPI